MYEFKDPTFTKKAIDKNTSLIARFKKTNLLIISFIAIMLSIIAYLILDVTSTNITTNISRTYAENTSSLFSSSVTNVIRDLGNLSKHPDVQDWYKDPDDPEKLEKMIDVYSSFITYTGYPHIWATLNKTEQQYIFSSDNGEGYIASVSNISPSNPLDLWHYQTLQATTPYVLNIDIDKILMQKSVWINYKVEDDDGNVYGLLALGIPYENILEQSYLNNSHIQNEYIIDHEGKIAITNDPKYKVYTIKDIEKLNNISIFSKYPSRVFQDYISNIPRHKGFFDVDYDDISFVYKNSVISVSPIVNTNWLVVKEESKLNSISSQSIYWTLFAFISALIIYSRIINGATTSIILDPFSRLTKDIRSKNFEKSTYDVEIFGSARKDELGLISRSIIDLKRDLFVQTRSLNDKTNYLRHNTDKIRRIYEVVPIGVLVFDTDLNLLSCNRNALNLFNVKNSNQFTSKYLKNGYLKKHNSLFYERFDYAKIVGNSVSEDIIKVSDEEEFWARIQVFYLLDENSISHYYEVYIHDIQNSKENEALLTKQAYIDALTNVYNRNYFNKLLTSELENIFNDDSDCGVLILDIDNFKRVNDVYGHNVGDIVLAKVADVVTNTKSDDEYFFRWGGEEFILFKAESSRTDMFNTAELIREAIESVEFEKLGNITVSIGIALESDKDYIFDTLFKRADEALYKAKKTGKNRSILFTDDTFYDKNNNII